MFPAKKEGSKSFLANQLSFVFSSFFPRYHVFSGEWQVVSGFPFSSVFCLVSSCFFFSSSFFFSFSFFFFFFFFLFLFFLFLFFLFFFFFFFSFLSSLSSLPFPPTCDDARYGVIVTSGNDQAPQGMVWCGEVGLVVFDPL